MFEKKLCTYTQSRNCRSWEARHFTSTTVAYVNSYNPRWSSNPDGWRMYVICSVCQWFKIYWPLHCFIWAHLYLCRALLFFIIIHSILNIVIVWLYLLVLGSFELLFIPYVLFHKLLILKHIIAKTKYRFMEIVPTKILELNCSFNGFSIFTQLAYAHVVWWRHRQQNDWWIKITQPQIYISTQHRLCKWHFFRSLSHLPL